MYNLSQTVCVTRILSLMTSFLSFSSLEVLAALLQKSISVLYSALFKLVIQCPNFPAVIRNAFYLCIKYSFLCINRNIFTPV